MQTIARVGVDIAKNVLQVHAVDARGNVVTNRAIQRNKFLAWCAQLPAGCLVAMEACGGAHHWCRQLQSMGFDARMIAAALVTPYRMQGKAARTTPMMQQPSVRLPAAHRCALCPLKQSTSRECCACIDCVKLREGFKEERTACINRIRGLLAEFGIVLPQSPRVLRSHLHDILEDASNDIAGTARLVLH